MPRPLDDTDIAILNLLQGDGRLELKQIARAVHKTVSPVHERIRKLEERGYIKRYMAVLDREKIGRSVLAVAQVTLGVHTDASIRGFEEAVSAMEPVLVCLNLSGPIDFLLHVIAGSTGEYHDFLARRLCKQPNVSHVESFLVLKESKVDTVYGL